MDVGTGYGVPQGTFHEDLVRVGCGTPGGEFMRRYWHPVAMVAEATRTPKLIKALGEDLVLFRDGSGRAGLLVSRCVHRGASLYYGATEEHGLRCCYHGWLFDSEGYCLEQPCEPLGGLHRDRVRQFQAHSLENLSTTDQGVTMLRRTLKRQIDRVAAGEDPAGVTFDPSEAQVKIEGGNFIVTSAGA